MSFPCEECSPLEPTLHGLGDLAVAGSEVGSYSARRTQGGYEMCRNSLREPPGLGEPWRACLVSTPEPQGHWGPRGNPTITSIKSKGMQAQVHRYPVGRFSGDLLLANLYCPLVVLAC